MQPLNPTLYAALQREFGRVRISNAGQAMSATYLQGRDGRPRLHPMWPGEYYVVACPFCHDTTGHLYVNHKWGVRDPMNGTRNLWLANCFLNDCLNDWDRRRDLADRLFSYQVQAKAGLVAVEAGKEAPPLSPVQLPEDFALLSKLPKGHPARRYVRSRGFAPAELSKVWGVGFSTAAYRSRVGRLVIPLRAYLGKWKGPAECADDPEGWEVVGFQGRAIVDADMPKYLTSQGTAKSQLLYGLDRVPSGAKSPVIVTEGPTDVWRAGSGAVALLGKTISDAQCKLLRMMLPGRNVVVMLDPDAASFATSAADRIGSYLSRDLRSGVRSGRVVVARLPDLRDPGDCTREEIWASARRALAGKKKRSQKG